MINSRYVMLDRDGVINVDSDKFIKSPQEWQAIPGSLEAIALMNDNGYKVVVITNQSGLSRGLFNLATLRQIHAKMRHQTMERGGCIENIYYCPHASGDNCQCRKPKPGMLQQFARDYQIRLNDIPFIGDSLRDIQAAQAVAAQPILVKTGKGEKTLPELMATEIPVFENLYEAAQFIVAR